MGNKRWTNHELNVIKLNYGKISLKEISKLIDRTEDAIQNKGRQLGLKYEDKYNYDIDYFKHIDNFDKAYWLGFIYADGYVSYNEEKRNYEFGIKLMKSDFKHLKKLNKCLNGNINISFHKRQTFLKYGINKYYEGCAIRLYSKKFVENLIDKGVIPNKTLYIKFPKLNEDLTWCFIRGYMDGDGHICIPKQNSKYGYRIGFTCASESFLIYLKNFLNKYGIISHINIDKKNGHTYKLEIREKQSIITYLENCYKNDTIYLDRKYEKYKILYKLLRQ